MNIPTVITGRAPTKAILKKELPRQINGRQFVTKSEAKTFAEFALKGVTDSSERAKAFSRAKAVAEEYNTAGLSTMLRDFSKETETALKKQGKKESTVNAVLEQVSANLTQGNDPLTGIKKNWVAVTTAVTEIAARWEAKLEVPFRDIHALASTQDFFAGLSPETIANGGPQITAEATVSTNQTSPEKNTGSKIRKLMMETVWGGVLTGLLTFGTMALMGIDSMTHRGKEINANYLWMFAAVALAALNFANGSTRMLADAFKIRKKIGANIGDGGLILLEIAIPTASVVILILGLVKGLDLDAIVFETMRGKAKIDTVSTVIASATITAILNFFSAADRED